MTGAQLFMLIFLLIAYLFFENATDIYDIYIILWLIFTLLPSMFIFLFIVYLFFENATDMYDRYI